MTDGAIPPDTDRRPANTEDLHRDPAERRDAVRERYARIATEAGSCCGETGCSTDHPAEESRQLGYSTDELDAVGPGANLGLGCGNPTAIATLEAGDTVLDLGSGAGFDCFLAAREVGPTGRVIGVDMTPEMLRTARENVEENDVSTVEFRLGEIEHLPVGDRTVDAVISNCVVNLSPDKPQVFREAYRVLRPGGRLAISDVVLTAQIPEAWRDDPALVASCVGGASSIPRLEAMLAEAGFAGISIEPMAGTEDVIREWDSERDLSEYLVSAAIEAEKPVD